LGTTVILPEHRMERVIPFADRMLSLDEATIAADGPPAEVLRETAIAPPLIELGRIAGWDPSPVSTRAARRSARALRDRLDHTLPLAAPNVSEAEPLLRATDVSVRYGAKTAVTGVDLDVYGGRVLGIMGRNGSGKSSLLWAMQGSGRRDSGSVDIGALDP